MPANLAYLDLKSKARLQFKIILKVPIAVSDALQCKMDPLILHQLWVVKVHSDLR